MSRRPVVVGRHDKSGFTEMTLSSCESQCSWRGRNVGFNEKLILKRKAILGPDNGDDKTVTILNLSRTWVCPSESCNQIEIEADPRHSEILLAQMKLDSANSKSVVIPAVKVQDAHKT